MEPKICRRFALWREPARNVRRHDHRIALVPGTGTLPKGQVVLWRVWLPPVRIIPRSATLRAVSRDPQNFMDMRHYRHNVARILEDGIIAAFHRGTAGR
jgi:hypothetical protein